MFSHSFVCILLIIILVIFLYYHFSKSNSSEKFTVAEDAARKAGYTSNILEDPAFSDIIVFYNDDDIYQKSSAMFGIDKCVGACKGKCLEFGITGKAYCFPES